MAANQAGFLGYLPGLQPISSARGESDNKCQAASEELTRRRSVPLPLFIKASTWSVGARLNPPAMALAVS
jgi:hypothetical protein